MCCLPSSSSLSSTFRAIALFTVLGWMGGCNQPRYESVPDGGALGPESRSDAGQLIPVGQSDGATPGAPLPDGGGQPAAGQFTLRVSVAGSGSGLVTAQPGGMCSDACSAMLPAGQVVMLTALPNPPAVFAGWSGACTGQGPCRVVMDAAREVVARFDLPEGVIWAQPVPQTGALLATGDSAFVAGAAFGNKSVGDRVFEGGAATTPFFARFGPDGKVQLLKGYQPGSISFGALASTEDGNIAVGGFVGSATAGARTVQMGKITPAGEVVTVVDRPNVEVMWNLGRRYLVLGANNGGFELFDDRGQPVPDTQFARPFVVADAVGLADGGWAIGGQFVGMLRLGDRTLSSTAGDWVVARWRADRSVVWAQTSPADKGARIERTTTNPAGDLLVAGNFTGQLQLLTNVFQNRGASALFVAKLAAANGSVIWGSAISAAQGISCSSMAATADAVYLALSSPGDLTIEGVTFKARAVVVKYDANTGAHVRSIPLDGSVLNLDVATDALFALGDRLWKLQL